MTYASIEYGHVYADEAPGPEQAETARLARRFTGTGVVMVDDYNVRNGHFDYRGLSNVLAQAGRRPDRIIGESDLAEAAWMLLARATGPAAKSQRRYFEKHGKLTCSALVAASYAVRLGLIHSDIRCRLTGRRLHPEKSLVNVLPDIYADTEETARGLLAAAGYGHALPMIDYAWTHVLNETTWERFRPEPYVDANYRQHHPADEWILKRLLDAWEEIGADGDVPTAIEVGCGPNLYPVLAAAPYVTDLRITDWSNRNLEYVRRQIRDGLDPVWEGWLPGHDRLRRAAVYRQSIFELPENAFDVVSMHFVAESITNSPLSFQLALQRVARALKTGGHLLASFMLGSHGYDVAGTSFPAVAVTLDDIRHALPLHVASAELVPGGGDVRPGYEGMAFVHAVQEA